MLLCCSFRRGCMRALRIWMYSCLFPKVVHPTRRSSDATQHSTPTRRSDLSCFGCHKNVSPTCWHLSFLSDAIKHLQSFTITFKPGT